MNWLSITLFVVFVSFVLGLSFYFGRRTKTASGYFAAGGQIHWSVNGIAFAGDYLSAASFLGICGMIATYGYDGFLYSIGYLAGWIVALFVVAEPMKRLGKYTFTDALDAKFDSRGIKLAAAISTLIVSICYLIPQMVGAGVLVEPLLGFPHYVGVIMVGAIVITIVATAGMTSTTYVQFLKGGMLVVFSFILVIAVCYRGLTTTPDQGGRVPFQPPEILAMSEQGDTVILANPLYQFVEWQNAGKDQFAKLVNQGVESWWKRVDGVAGSQLEKTQWVTAKKSGEAWINGAPESPANQLRLVGHIESLEGNSQPGLKTGSISPFRFLSILGDKATQINLYKSAKVTDRAGETTTMYYRHLVSGNRIMRPGLKFKVEGTLLQKLDFVSLMLALFFGTSALPHILIRYYTVPSPACARKSTIVAIAAIGFFYILTLYMGLGAMTSATVNLLSDNMSAPLLARSFGTFLFSVISALAFATVLGTVSGLIVAASGAVAHDLMDRFLKLRMTEQRKIMAGKIVAFVVGTLAIILGILFRGMNVSFLVGLAFAVAASANLPAIVMLLFWKKTTAKGVTASIIVGIVSSLGIILLSPDLYKSLYGLDPARAPVPFSNPGIISIPLSFLALVVVSLLTANKPALKKAKA